MNAYSAKDVRELCTMFKINWKLYGEEVRLRLNGAANVYAIYKINYDDAPGRTHIRAALDEIHCHARALEAALSNLDDWSTQALWFNRSSAKDAVELSEIEGFHQSVEILKERSAEALSRLEKDKGGPRSSEAMRMWVINLRNLWVDVLKRPFTVDHHKGEGITPAFEFCWQAMKIYAPSVNKSALITAMRKVISEYPS
ncbi:MAG: hypothetical protein HQL45_17770 [Alphaproteobacteria bacterium]|nr:hypothetical protein [Alphaproteobacteria bacterium]